MNRIEIYQKIAKHLYKDKETSLQHLTPNQYAIKQRVMLSVSKVLDNPLIQDKELVQFLENGCGGLCEPIKSTQAYRDIAGVKLIVGNIKGHTTDWYRYMIVEGAKEAFEIARKKEDAKGMAAALDKIGKYTRADKIDDQQDFSELTPPNFEPTDDVTVLENTKPIENLEEKRKEFRELFKNKLVQNAADTTPYDTTDEIS